MSRSRVKSVSVSGSWEKDGTTYHNHQYEMEDGHKIQASHKTSLPFNVGDEIEYEVRRTHEKYGDQGTVKKPNDFKGGGYKPDTVGITVGNALNNVSLLIAHGKLELKDLERDAERFVNVALTLKEKFKDADK